VIFNTITQEVVGFVEPDSSGLNFPADVASRWLSPDPLAAKYPEMSPYVGIGNNPIIFVDLDGKKIIPAGKEEAKGMTNMISSAFGKNAGFKVGGAGSEIKFNEKNLLNILNR
jgi:outer membrane protein W